MGLRSVPPLLISQDLSDCATRVKQMFGCCAMGQCNGMAVPKNSLGQEYLGYTKKSLGGSSQGRRVLLNIGGIWLNSTDTCKKWFIQVFFKLCCFPVDLLESGLALPKPCKPAFVPVHSLSSFWVLMSGIIWPNSSSCSVRSHFLFSTEMFLLPHLRLSTVVTDFPLTFWLNHAVLLCYFVFLQTGERIEAA